MKADMTRFRLELRDRPFGDWRTVAFGPSRMELKSLGVYATGDPLLTGKAYRVVDMKES